MGLVPVLPFVGGLFAFLLVDWARQLNAVHDRDVLRVPFLSVVELAYLCGGERRARATIAGALQLRGEQPEVLARESVVRLQQSLSAAELLQRSFAWRAIHLLLALLPLAGLAAFSSEVYRSPGDWLLGASLLVGVVSWLSQLRHCRGLGWELSPLGHEVSFRFRARLRALRFFESGFPSWLTRPSVGLACGLALVCGSQRWAGSEKATAPERVVDRGAAPSPPKKDVAPPGSADRDPEVASEFKAPYPNDARRAGIGGTVRMRIVIDNEGRVADVQVLSGPGFGLNEVAREAMKRFKFRPALKRGEPVSTTVVYKYIFVLD